MTPLWPLGFERLAAKAVDVGAMAFTICVRTSWSLELSGQDPEHPPESVKGKAGLPAKSSSSGVDLLKASELTRYLAEIRRYPLLTREEEQSFARAYQEHGDKDAARKLVTGNLRLVVKIALEYRRAWVNVMDLIQEGNIGLAEAVKRFDPYREVRFSSFARYWIRALILQFILKNFRLVSFGTTRAGRKLFFRLEKERARLMQEFGEATPKMLAESLDVPEEEVVAATVLKKHPLSLTSPRSARDDSNRTLGETIADKTVDVEADVIRGELMKSVDVEMKIFASQLQSERESAIWHERLIAEDPTSLASLGERFSISRERVRQLEARLKKKLRAHLTDKFGPSLELDFSDE